MSVGPFLSVRMKKKAKELRSFLRVYLDGNLATFCLILPPSAIIQLHTGRHMGQREDRSKCVTALGADGDDVDPSTTFRASKNKSLIFQ
jgi:hypothetical protein